MLFYTCMDEYSIKLNPSGKGGGNIGGHLINHVCYADDLRLNNISYAGMSSLLDLCITYTIEHLFTYNGSKSFSFKPKYIKFHATC